LSPTEMAQQRKSHTATLLTDGRVLIAGGENVSGGVVLATAELYDPVSRTFSATGSMNFTRKFHTATLFTGGPMVGEVLIAGGEDGSGNPVGTAEVYHPSTGTFSNTGSLTFAREKHAAVLLQNNDVFVVGGLGGGGIAEIYDPNQGAFQQVFGFTDSG